MLIGSGFSGGVGIIYMEGGPRGGGAPCPTLHVMYCMVVQCMATYCIVMYGNVLQCNAMYGNAMRGIVMYGNVWQRMVI